MLAAQCCLFRTHLLSQERTEFVWGGCMLFRAAEMRHDARGILRVRAGGFPPRALHPLIPCYGPVRRRSAGSPPSGRKPSCRPQPPPYPSGSGNPATSLPTHSRPQPLTQPCTHAPTQPNSTLAPARKPTLQAWQDGGYSDDLTVASKCTELGLLIYCPGYSIFPQW